jgi:NADP-dependent alcohol dehydrogenase
MDNFTYHNPTRILFGRGVIASIGAEIPEDARVLMTYGGGSIKANGVYEQVQGALGGRTVVEFGGIEPNPHYETLMPAVDAVRAQKLDYLLAVGGGSVLDGTKFITAAVGFQGDPWDILVANAPVRSALPIGAVLTLPATGSESNGNAVITRRERREKRAFGSPLVYPRFAALDPATTCSLPRRQTANGIVDAFVHVMEQYMTYPADAPLQDRMAEAILCTLTEVGPRVLASPDDYAARANLMWCATQALNGLIAVGVPQDWSTHMIGHEITAEHGLDHAQTLAIVLPGVLSVKRDTKRAKLLQYGRRVFGLEIEDTEDGIDETIASTRAFFESVGCPTRLSAYGLGAETVCRVPERLARQGLTALGERGDIDPPTVERILRECV